MTGLSKDTSQSISPVCVPFLPKAKSSACLPKAQTRRHCTGNHQLHLPQDFLLCTEAQSVRRHLLQRRSCSVRDFPLHPGGLPEDTGTHLAALPICGSHRRCGHRLQQGQTPTGISTAKKLRQILSELFLFDKTNVAAENQIRQERRRRWMGRS